MICFPDQSEPRVNTNCSSYMELKGLSWDRNEKARCVLEGTDCRSQKTEVTALMSAVFERVRSSLKMLTRFQQRLDCA